MTSIAFHFLRPYWLMLFIPLAWLCWRLMARSQDSIQWRKICDPHLLPALLVNQTSLVRRWPVFLLTLAWVLAVFALSGPTWSQYPQTVYRQQQAQIIVLDLSLSMLATDIAPSRIERARYKLLDILKHSQEGQTGLLVFAAEPYVVSPLTQDTGTIAALVPELSPDLMPAQGQAVGSALKKAGDLLKQAKVKQGHIILLSASAASADDLKIARQLLEQGYRISVLAIGTLSGAPIPLPNGGFAQDDSGKLLLSPLPNASLQTLAQAGGGNFSLFTNTNTDLEQLLHQHSSHRFAAAEKTDQTANIWRDQGLYFIWPILLFALCLFRRGWFREALR